MRKLLILPEAIAGVAIFAMMVHVTADALCRYFLNAPLPSTIEIASLYYMVPVSVLPLAGILALDEMIKVDLVKLLFPSSKQRYFTAFSLAVTALAAIACIVWMSQAAWDKTRIGEVWESVRIFVPAWPARWFLPLGFFLLAVVALVRLRELFGLQHDRH